MTDMETKRARGKGIANVLVCQLCWTFLLRHGVLWEEISKYEGGHALNIIASYEQNEKFNKQTYLTSPVTFIFQPIFHIHLSIYSIQLDHGRELTAAIFAPVVKTTRQAGRFFSLILNTFPDSLSKFLTPNMYCNLVKQLSPYIWRISKWMTLMLSHMNSARENECQKESCSLWDFFNSNVAMFNVYNWRHSDVIVIKFTAFTQE